MFSPRYFRARRRNPDVDPQRYCGFNVALRSRAQERWAFTEYGTDALERRPDVLTLGKNQVRRIGDEVRVSIDDRCAPVPRVIRGDVRFIPEAIFNHPLSLDHEGIHRWRAVAPLGRIEVELEEPALRFTGSAYHDMNFGDRPLESTLRSWNWSRAAGNRNVDVLYDVVPREGEPLEHGLSFSADGSVRPVDPGGLVNQPLGRSRWGIRRGTRCDRAGDARIVRTLEDTPFYARSMVSTSLLGRRSDAVHESIDFDRYQNPCVQLMLPFKIRGGWWG